MKISLRHTAFSLLAVLTVLLMAGTVCAQAFGQEFAVRFVYAAPWTVALWALLVAVGGTYVVRRTWRKSFAVLLLHAAFVLILAGAAVTHFFGLTGTLQLAENAAPTALFENSETHRVEHMPFAVALQRSTVEYYRGTRAPVDFVSDVMLYETDPSGKACSQKPLASGRVSMNRVFSYGGYRFFQTGIGEGASTLNVQYDPWGIGLTYGGYALLFFSMLAVTLRPLAGKVRKSPMKSAFFAVLALGGSLLLAAVPQEAGAQDVAVSSGSALGQAGTRANDLAPRTMQRPLAKRFGELYVYYNDRLCPVQTLAKDFCTTLTGKSTWEGMTAEQVLAGWMYYYADWRSVRMIKIKSARVRRMLGIDGQWACISDFYSPQGYRLASHLTRKDGTLDKEVATADEQARMVSEVCTGRLLRLFPVQTKGDGSGADASCAEADAIYIKWYAMCDDVPAEATEADAAFQKASLEFVARCLYSGKNVAAAEALSKIREHQQAVAGDVLPDDAHFRAELLYNRAVRPLPAAICALLLGILLLFVPGRIRSGRRAVRISYRALWLLPSLVLTAYLVAAFVLRTVVSGHLPLSNGHETMMALALVLAALSLVSGLCSREKPSECAANAAETSRKRSAKPVFSPLCLLACGATLLVAMMSGTGQGVSQLMPVLASPLLSVHVCVIVLAYALLFVMALLSVFVLWRHDASASALQRKLMQPAVFLLTAGIFLGAVWANQSWGRYWGWDPKEVWALVTMLVYSVPLHGASLPLFRRERVLAWYLLIAFASVLMTYFGVNFLLGGLHSYATT